jgi:hypothetical protein
MRKMLIATALLAGTGIWAAWASENRADPTRQDLQQGARAPTGTDTLRKDDEGLPRDDRSHKVRERHHEERRQAHGNDEDDDD